VAGAADQEGEMVQQRIGRRAARRAATAGVLGGLGLLLSGCASNTGNKWIDQTLNFGFPTGVTPNAEHLRGFWTGTVVTSLIVGVFVWGLIFWSMAFHRKRKGDDEFPRQTGYNVPLELVYTAVPFLVISVLFYFTVLAENRMVDLRPELEVRLQPRRRPRRLDRRRHQPGGPEGRRGGLDPLGGGAQGPRPRRRGGRRRPDPRQARLRPVVPALQQDGDGRHL